MSEITGNYNINSNYQAYTTDSTGQSQASATEKNKQLAKTQVKAEKESVDINDLINQRPELKAAFTSLMALGNNPDMGDSEIFTIQRLIASLINLGQALQQAATAYANKLAKVTEKMNAYSKMLGQVPVLLKENINYNNLGNDDTQRSQTLGNINQKFGNMLEAIRANKGMEEDKAKKIQTIMQTMKDAGQSANDFIGTFIDLLRGISQKIAR